MKMNLKTVETVKGGNNGYPSGFQTATIGFASFEEAQNYADENGMTLIRLHKRDGWQMYERLDTVWDAITPTSDWYGDDYNFLSCDDQDDVIDEAKSVVVELDTIDDMVEYLNRKKELIEELSAIDEKQWVVTRCGEYYETIDRECMEWSHDTHSYIIGAINLV